MSATLMAKCKINGSRTVDFPVPLGECEDGSPGPPQTMPIWLGNKDKDSAGIVYHLVLDHWDAKTDLVWYRVQTVEA